MSRQESNKCGRILIVEDDDGVRELIVKKLTKAGYELTEAADGQSALQAVQTALPDALLLDQRLSDMTGIQLHTALVECGKKLPFIVMTGHGDERLAVTMMKLGAADYLIKDTEFIDILPLAVERLFKSIEAERQLLESEHHFRTLANGGSALIWTSGTDKLCNYFNEPWLRFTGRSLEQELGNGWADGVHPEDFDRCIEIFTSHFDCLEPFSMEYRLRHATGDYRWILDEGNPRYDSEGRFLGYVGYCYDITERRRAEEALAESEGILRDILESALSGFWDWNLVDNTEYLSPTFKKMFGYEDHEMDNSPEAWQRIIFPEDLPGVLEVFDRHVKSRGREPFYNEVRYRHRDGSTVWVICTGRVIKWAENDTPSRMVGCHVDITSRKQMEEALRENEQLLDATGFMARVGGWQLDLETMAVTWTKETYRIHEVPLNYKSQVDKAIEFYHPDDRQALSQALQQALDRGEPFDMELRFITAKGNNRWVRSTCQPEVLDGKTVSLRGTFQDITEQKQREDELSRSRELVQSLLDSVGEAIYGIDLTGCCTFSNQVCRDILGYSEAELTSRNMHDLIHHTHADGRHTSIAECGIYRSFQSGEPSILADELLWRADGTSFPAEIRSYPFFHADRLIGAVVSFRDMTESRQQEYKTFMLRRMASLGEMATGVAHEINNPITGIINCAQLLKERLPAGNSCLDITERISREGTRIAKIVKSLLMITHPGLNRQERVCLRTCMETVMILCQTKLVNSGIDLEVDLPADLPAIDGEPQMIEQLLLNLLNNAHHALNERYPERHQEKRLTVTGVMKSMTRGARVCLSVEDQGTGVRPEHLGRLFDPFFTTKPAGVGTGLGLGLCHEIVRRHHGEIRVESEFGKFTRVTIELPAAIMTASDQV